MKALRLAAILAAIIAVGGGSSSRADFLNGSFEDGDYTFDGQGADSLNPGATNITGWTTFGAELAVIRNANSFGLETPFGDAFLDLTGYHDSAPYGGVQQSISTVAGQAYDLVLYLGVNNSRNDSFAPISVQVTAGSSSTTLTADPTETGMIWTLETWSFVADSATTTVSIQGASTANGHLIGLDNLSVTPRSVPEPTSLVTLGMGAIGALGYFRRRRANPPTDAS